MCPVGPIPAYCYQPPPAPPPPPLFPPPPPFYFPPLPSPSPSPPPSPSPSPSPLISRTAEVVLITVTLSGFFLLALLALFCYSKRNRPQEPQLITEANITQSLLQSITEANVTQPLLQSITEANVPRIQEDRTKGLRLTWLESKKSGEKPVLARSKGLISVLARFNLSKMEQVKLLGNHTSPFNRRVIWALKLKGVAFEFMQEEDLYSNKSELLLKSNPVHKKIPVLIHDGKPIAESTVILEYIEETWPENPLLPKDAHERAKARFWIKFMEDKIHIMFQFFLSVGGEEEEKAKKDCLELLRTIEEQGLDGDKKFFGGDNIGLTDLVFGFMAYQWELMEEIVGVKLMEAHSFPRLHGWAENFKSVSVIKENLPDRDRLEAHLKRRREMLPGSSHQN